MKIITYNLVKPTQIMIPHPKKAKAWKVYNLHKGEIMVERSGCQKSQQLESLSNLHSIEKVIMQLFDPQLYGEILNARYFLNIAMMHIDDCLEKWHNS